MGSSSQLGATPQKSVKARVKVWLELDDRYFFGFGLSEILKAVQAEGSIKAGAERLGKSYRHVWQRIKEAEKALGQPLVLTRVGGKEEGRGLLTALAEFLMRDYDALRRRMIEIADEEFSSKFQPPPS